MGNGFFKAISLSAGIIWMGASPELSESGAAKGSCVVMELAISHAARQRDRPAEGPEGRSAARFGKPIISPQPKPTRVNIGTGVAGVKPGRGPRIDFAEQSAL